MCSLALLFDSSGRPPPPVRFQAGVRGGDRRGSCDMPNYLLAHPRPTARAKSPSFPEHAARAEPSHFALPRRESGKAARQSPNSDVASSLDYLRLLISCLC